MQILIPEGFHSRRQAAKISLQKCLWSLCCRWPPRSPCHLWVLPEASTPSSSPPRSLCTIVPDHGRGPYAPPSSVTRVGATVDNAGLVPKPVTPFPSLQRHGPPWAWDTCNVVILPKSARLHCIFFFVILGIQILILVCYIATLLWSATLSHFFDMLHCFCSAPLLWCATLSHYFDMLHCL
jgi:hypothetical protein